MIENSIEFHLDMHMCQIHMVETVLKYSAEIKSRQTAGIKVDLVRNLPETEKRRLYEKAQRLAKNPHDPEIIAERQKLNQLLEKHGDGADLSVFDDIRRDEMFAAIRCMVSHAHLINEGIIAPDQDFINDLYDQNDEWWTFTTDQDEISEITITASSTIALHEAHAFAMVSSNFEHIKNGDYDKIRVTQYEDMDEAYQEKVQSMALDFISDLNHPARPTYVEMLENAEKMMGTDVYRNHFGVLQDNIEYGLNCLMMMHLMDQLRMKYPRR